MLVNTSLTVQCHKMYYPSPSADTHDDPLTFCGWLHSRWLNRSCELTDKSIAYAWYNLISR